MLVAIVWLLMVANHASAQAGPVAADDSYTTLAGQVLQVPAPGVKGNDQNAGGLFPVAASEVVGGTVTLRDDGSITFTPFPGFSGAAGFAYCLTASFPTFPTCLSNVARVSITVTRPTAVDDSYSTLAGQALTVPAPGVKANDQNVAPAMSAIRAGEAVGGTVTLNPDGSFTFTPNPGFSGTASFPYCLSTQFPDCHSNVATVRISVPAPTAVGDTYLGAVGQALTVPAPGVRSNDQNVSSNLSAIRAGNAVGGDVVLSTDGSFTFTPSPNFVGTASFPYCYSAAGSFPTCLSNVATVTIEYRKARPALSTVASSGGLLGAPVRDVATLRGGQNPTGTVTFRLFSDPACGTEVFQSANPVSGSTSTSNWFVPAASGTYYWTASYSGDARNEAVTSPCQAPNEQVTIAPFVPPPFTRTITGDFAGPLTVNAGESVLITNARVVGPVTVNPGGSLTVVGSRISRGIVANAPRFLSVCGTDVSGPSPATALSVTGATVPIRVGDPATGCAGNRFAGQVSLTNNLALTFGANAVSHNVTIDGNGPGNTVVKANTVVQTLACAGNNPAPTNAGQVNTAASKTGQCASL